MDFEKLEVIDFEAKGNVVRFYLGKNGKQWGDDWDDAPYEDNAGEVYDRYVKGTVDVAFDFEKGVFAPVADYRGVGYTKKGMIERRYPCLTVGKGKNGDWYWSYDDCVKDSKSWRIYFGDHITKEKLEEYGGHVIGVSVAG